MPGGVQVLRLGQDPDDHLEQLLSGGCGPCVHRRVPMGAFNKKGLPLPVAQGPLKASQVRAVNIPQKVAEQQAVARSRSEQDLAAQFTVAISNELETIVIERCETVSDESGLSTCGSWLLLQQVGFTNGLVPLVFCRVLQKQACNVATLRQHQGARRDFCVVERRNGTN